ncbi:MAG TPA: KamA family radical SAM protein [Polyangiales bacterium]
MSKAAGMMAEDDAEPPGLGLQTIPLAEQAQHERTSHRDQTEYAHRQILEGDFWRLIPAYEDVSEATFLDHHWQSQHAVTRVDKLAATLGHLLPEPFFRDVQAGLTRAPMSLRISPYIMALIDWRDPYSDPLRKQFLPLGSEQIVDHPMVGFDSLHERSDSPVPGLVHRYPDKALFLALDLCPVYCRFCTRSYSVGVDTEGVSKYHLRAKPERWEMAFEYLRNHDEIEDVVVSGGDVHNLRADQIADIGDTLLDIPHIRRMRFATKAIAVQPTKFLTDDEWVSALIDVAQRGRKLGKEVAVHTHVSHPREITWITRAATRRLYSEGVTVRNQCVLLRGVNDDPQLIKQLVKKLSYINVQPYYVYQHDLVPGVEDLRTTLGTAIAIEKQVRGSTAGFNTPSFILDAPGGGGKRDVHSFEHYDRTTGVSVFRSPNIDDSAVYLYFDPIELLPPEGRAQWADPNEHGTIIGNAVIAAGQDPAVLPSGLFAPRRRLPVM